MNELRAHIDYETGSAAELVGPRSVGVHRYFEDVTTRVWLFSWRIGSTGPKQRYHPDDPDPVPLLEFIARGGIVVAHNAMFERTAWSFMKDKYKLHHWPDLQIKQQRCTMAKAVVLNLPAGLEQLGEVLALKHQKDIVGNALMKKMAKPIANKYSKELKWNDAPENITRLGTYCDGDIDAETEADETLPDLSAFEQQIWELDQIINDRGIPLDLPSIVRAIDVVEYAKKRANLIMKELTGGAVEKCSQVQEIVKWVNTQGIACTSFKKGDHDDLIVLSGFAGNERIEKVVELRRDSSKTSTAKFVKMLDCIMNDGRSRGCFAYAGATQTLRFAGRLWQPQNMRRVDWERDELIIQWTLWCLNAPMSTSDTYDMIEIGVGGRKDNQGNRISGVLDALSLCLRLMVKAEPGHVLYGCDWANIEGRLNAWLAGEAWKLQAFRDYDAGTGPDLYKLAYSRSFGKPVELIGKGMERQVGKVQELALGYQGGVGALLRMMVVYNVKIWEIVEPVRNATPPDIWQKVCDEFKSATDKHGLLVEQWAAAKIVVRNWRAAHPLIKASWYELEDAAVMAVSSPGQVIDVYNGRCRYLSDGHYLYCQLPNGGVIAYPQPHIRYVEEQHVLVNDTWVSTDEFFEFELDLMRQAGAQFKKRGKNVVWFYGVDQETKQWRPQYLYGGHQCENIVQATAAQVLRYGLLAVEAAGYPIILHAHDEILAHVKKGFGSLDHFKSLMMINEPWLAGCPLAVSAFEDERYG